MAWLLSSLVGRPSPRRCSQLVAEYCSTHDSNEARRVAIVIGDDPGGHQERALQQPLNGEQPQQGERASMCAPDGLW